MSPHALRAIGAWPFLSLLVGFGVTGLLAGLGDAVLFRVRLTTLARAALVALTVQFSVPFLIDYARGYPERAQHHFDVAVVQTLKDPGAPRPDGYPALAARYFDLVYRGLDRCP